MSQIADASTLPEPDRRQTLGQQAVISVEGGYRGASPGSVGTVEACLVSRQPRTAACAPCLRTSAYSLS